MVTSRTMEECLPDGECSPIDRPILRGTQFTEDRSCPHRALLSTGVTFKGAPMNAMTKTAQLRLAKTTPAYWRVTFDNPPLNLMGPQFVLEFTRTVDAVEADDDVRVVVFDSAVEGFFLNHSDFTAKIETPTSLPQGPTAWRPGPTSLCDHPRPGRLDCLDPRRGDWQRQRTRAGL